MLATRDIPITHPEIAERSTIRSLGDIRSRAAGFGALGFVATVLAQNAIRGSAAPANGAGADDVLRYYADHRITTFVLVATYVLGTVAMATFLGGGMRRLTSGPRVAWAYTGLVGAVGIIGLFSVLVASEQALSVLADGPTPDTGAVSALWTLHNSVFAVLLMSIAVALLGLSRAGVAAGITPAVFQRLAPVGSALLVVGTLAGPAIAGGDAMPLFGIGVLGFVVWLAFLVTTGLRLVRTEVTA